ncbi:MAG: DUF1232 domain-containing protein [Chloroflexi bacterium]|nr:DUF1232 domain-containing protein [Chloroflexota bacterium]MBT6680874.1 DUF1232 domain-containing protein [Chloroflexota bacterium]
MRAVPLLRYLWLILPAIRLAWGLFLDRRVRTITKVLPILAVLYVLSPLDLLPDIIPVVGWMDDLIVAGGLLLLFFILAPTEVVFERLRGSTSRKETQEPIGETIDGTFRYTDEGPPR